MKKQILIFIVLMLILLSAVSCNKKTEKPNSEETQNGQNTVTTTTSTTASTTTTVINELDPDNLVLDGVDQNTPSTALIVENLKSSFPQINENAVVTDAKTDKSFTTVRQFEITLNVSAQSKYADWNYTAFMKYTLYDQGWMVDDIQWNDGTYEVKRHPSDEEMYGIMISQLSETFKPTSDTVIEYNYSQTSEEGKITCSWNTLTVLKHGEHTTDYSTEWSYDARCDEWLIEGAPYVNHNNVTVYDVDLSGYWECDSVSYYSTESYINISNFSWDEFDLKWEKISGIDDGGNSHFTIYDESYSFNTLRYSNNNGYHVFLQLYDDCTKFSISKNTTSYYYHFLNANLYEMTDVTPGSSVGLKYHFDNWYETFSVVGEGLCTDTKIIVPESFAGYPVTAIGENAFEYNDDITEVTVPKSVKTIKAGAFSNCDSLTRIMLNSGLSTIGKEAFSYCDNLKEIYIPESVTSIGRLDYENKYEIPPSDLETEIYGDKYKFDLTAFIGCSKLEKITVNENNQYFYSKSNCLIDKGDNILILGCKNSEIPDTVDQIYDYAFYGASDLRSIKIPFSITYIGECAFSNTGLRSIVIPDSVSSIGGKVFYDCEDLEAVVLSASIKVISPYAFARCGFTSITIPKSVVTIEGMAFSHSDLTEITIPGGVKSIKYGAFMDCYTLKKVAMKKGLEIIGDEAFSGCSSLTEIILPSGLKTIGHGAFSYCKDFSSYDTGLKYVYIPLSVTYIDYYAFSDCPYNLTIHCAAQSQPESWDDYWNYDYWDDRYYNVLWDQQAEWDDEEPDYTEGVLFYDSFDDLYAFYDNWNVIGDLSILADPSGDLMADIQDGKMIVSKPQNNFRAYLDDRDWMNTDSFEYANYAIKTVIRGTADSPYNNFGIIFRASDISATGPDGYYGMYVGIGDPDGKLCIGYATYSWHSVDYVDFDYNPNQDYTLEVIVIDDRFVVLLDGEKMYEGECLFDYGTVGLRTFEQLFEADEFEVRAITAYDYEYFDHIFN